MIDWEPEAQRPLWIQVAEVIQSRIENGTYPPNTAIPSLPQLQQEFRVGRNTVKHAVSYLTEEGWVKPISSLGTFVLVRDGGVE